MVIIMVVICNNNNNNNNSNNYDNKSFSNDNSDKTYVEVMFWSLKLFKH